MWRTATDFGSASAGQTRLRVVHAALRQREGLRWQVRTGIRRCGVFNRRRGNYFLTSKYLPMTAAWTRSRAAAPRGLRFASLAPGALMADVESSRLLRQTRDGVERIADAVTPKRWNYDRSIATSSHCWLLSPV
jgi:beta-galactosidase GanA